MARTPTAENTTLERTPAIASRRRRTLLWHLQRRAFLLMLVPGLGMYLVSIVYPFITSFVYGFYNWSQRPSAEGDGLVWG
jgi:ABC-type sugar transport system permease subunit